MDQIENPLHDLPMALLQARATARMPRAIPLGRVDGVFRLVAGQADVFAVDPRRAIYGPLSHLFRLSKGDVFAGLADIGHAADGPDILVIPAPGCGIVADAAASRSDELDRWTAGLLAAGDIALPPRGITLLKAGHQIAMQEGAAVCAAAPLLWLETEDMLTACNGGRLDAGLVPLTPDFWVQAPGQVAARIVDSQALGEAGMLHAGRRSATALALTGIGAALRRAEKQADDDVHRRETATQLRLDATTGDVAALLHRKARQPAGVLEPDALMRCAARVAAADGIELHAGRPLLQAPRGEAIAAIARLNHVRARRARLPEGWWRGDYGAFVGFCADGAPVCLLPARFGYRAVDADGHERRVDAAFAAGLVPEAYIFYRPMPNGKMTARALLGFVFKNNGRAFATILIASACSALLALLTPLVSGHIFDTIIPKAEYDQLKQVTIVLVAAASATLGFGMARALTQLRLRGRVDAVVQSAVWDRLLRLPAGFFQLYEVGDLASRASGINALSRALSGSTLSALFSGLFSVASLAMMLYYQPMLAVIAIGFVAVVIVISCAFAYLQLLYQRDQYALSGKLAARTFQFVSAIATLKVNGAERLAYADWTQRFARDMHFRLRSNILSYSEGLLTSGVLIVFHILALAFFAFYADNVSTGTFIAFNTAFGQFYGGFSGFAGAFVTLMSLKPLYERTEPILAGEPEISGARTDPGEVTGRIAVNHVSFAFEGTERPILDDVTMEIRAGEFVAVVGPSGSGKSTLMRLLLGFVTPQKGAVTYDDHDLAKLDPSALRRQLGVVLQDGKLLTGSIRDNITANGIYGEAEIWQAVIDSGLEADLRAMPMGLQTPVGEGAATFSGGQKQRLLIARALVRKPRIVLFDEATSALDNITQAQVSAALERMKATRIVIAHRLSTIRHADRIYVLDRGRIVEQGSYDTLIEQDGAFAALAKRQLS
ncbi:NHLP bacteriocin export ABC transporter permease/ATPase subunit [Martelella alba]|uniref:NHLP bacteriocin export ABC transporter permease/ATPase subunit n=1 Tax=Martelella alba TaxID=2590451 RepID=A0A506U435_9HYPH|nr:NHLP bacteriocin export ABC transporter permease/ATPase subunit [Martelella alba]TPW26637.1 NHLP bacteriocin export ABC transporter permease/ATPase subunit [Martelella alba]